MKIDCPGFAQIIAATAMLCATVGAVWLIHSSALAARKKTPAENQWECLGDASDRFKILACQQAYKDDVSRP